jgi:hypothetical protein
MGTNALMLGLVIATADGPGAALPKDPCALLKPAEVQALAPNAKIGAGVASTVSAVLNSFACEYKWGSGGNAVSGLYTLQVIVSDLSKTFPGMEPGTIREGLLLEAGKPGATATVIPGVGNGAIFDSNAPIRASTTALVKGSMLQVVLEGPDARTKKDQVIALLKAAAGRL